MEHEARKESEGTRNFKLDRLLLAEHIRSSPCFRDAQPCIRDRLSMCYMCLYDSDRETGGDAGAKRTPGKNEHQRQERESG